MTLLTTEDLEQTRRDLADLEERCVSATELTPYELGCRAFGLAPSRLSLRKQVRVACVPVTAGNGILGDFCHIVAAIIEQLAGTQVFVTEGTDVTGMEEAIWSKAHILFMADDETFVAYNTRTGVLSDNSIATGRIFAAVLERAAGTIRDEEALVLGAGKVGLGAYSYLKEQGVKPCWYDAQIEAPAGFDSAFRCADWQEYSWRYIVDATTAPALVEASHVLDESMVSAPGVPFGVSPGAVEKARFVFHDNLAMGVVSMLCQALGEGRRG